jgi:hypothetical protein
MLWLTAIAMMLPSCQQSNESNLAPNEPSAAPASGPLGVEPGWELMPAGATFSASQSGGQVTVRAGGENPTAGYVTKLTPSPLRIWPPQYLLVRHPPDGMAAQVITPYTVSANFNSTDRVATIIVTDAAGKHEVKVEQTK